MNVYVVSTYYEFEDDSLYHPIIVFATRKLACDSLKYIVFDDYDNQTIDEFLNSDIDTDSICVVGKDIRDIQIEVRIQCLKVIE